MQDYLADAQQFIPPGEVVEAVHRWQDRTGNRLRCAAPSIAQRVVKRKARVVTVEFRVLDEE